MNKAKKDYLQILIFQILTFPIVVGLFAFIHPPKIAALFAGSLFLIFGIFAMVKVQVQPKAKNNPLLWVLYIHLFVIALPLLCVRMLNWETPFEHLVIFGLPAPIFHTMSGYVYTAILVLTIFNLWRVWKS